MHYISESATRSALNHLVVACHNDSVAFDAAALIVSDPFSKARLIEQSQRRATFREDLSASVIRLGGKPAGNASYRARFAAALRVFKGFVAGKHQGDAYAACARAEVRTEAVYSAVLLLELPDDTRYGLLRQHVEIELDRRELRRLRWDHQKAVTPETESLDGMTFPAPGSSSTKDLDRSPSPD